jgi:dienelactone hydrolase
MFQRVVCIGLFVALVTGMPAVAGEAVAVTLSAADQVKVRGDLYALEGEDRLGAPVILLFHQAGSNRGEYVEIARRLNEHGFHALAIDQRSGGKRWGFDNETVTRYGESTGYLEAMPDLAATLKWKTDAGYTGPTVIWGSSYSAALVLLLAAGHPQIDGILSFSPGEYLDTRSNEVREAAERVQQPVLVLTPEDERDRATQIFEVIPSEDKKLVIPELAVHGSSMLVPERNPGAEKIWPEVLAFLDRFSD